jgi:hypothetical protein
MTFDDLDRRVEEHLASTASRMPDYLRASVLEDIPRRGQVGPGWPRVGAMARLSLAAGVLAATVFVVVRAPALLDPAGPGAGDRASATPDFVWDAVLNFRDRNPSMDVYGNPSVWSYLHAPGGVHDPTQYLRLTEFDQGAGEAWIDPAHEGLAIGVVPGANGLTVEPWGRSATEIEAAIVAWRDPFGGPITVSGLVEVDAACGDGIDVAIDQGDRTIEQFSLPSESRAIDLAIDMRRGETLYVRVEPGTSGNGDCDTTWLTLTITR